MGKQNNELSATKTGAIMIFATLFGMLFGFGREIVLSNFFGTTYVIDAYNVANSIPGILFGGIFSAIGTAYMPIFSKITENESVGAGRKFTNQVISLLMIVSIICSVIGIIFSSFLVNIIAPGFDYETAKLSSTFLKVIFCYDLFSGITGILNSYLRYNGVFVRQILIAYINDIAIIIGAFIAFYFGYIYLAIGVLCGHILNCIITTFVGRTKGYRFRFNFSLGEPVKEIVALSIPVFIGSSVSQVNSFIDKFLASGLQEGSIAALGYGSLIPSSLVAISSSVIATILYPKISKAANTGQMDVLNDMVKRSITVAIMIVLPFSLGAMAFSDQIVQVIYERGAFSTNSTSLTSSAMLCYAVGMVFTAVNSVFVNVSYSVKDMKLPLICSIAGIATNICMNLVLIKPMAHNGLALATSMASMVSASLIVILMRKHHPEIRGYTSKAKLVKIVVCAVIAVGIAIGVYKFMMGICIVRTVNLAAAVVASVICYLIALKIARVEEIEIIWEIL